MNKKLLFVLLFATTGFIFSSGAHAQVGGPITVQLDFGARGDDVIRLQAFLAKDPAIYPEGIVSGYFGPLTRSAFMRFQSRNELPPVGRVGPLTLARINVLIQGADEGPIALDVYAPIITNVAVSTASTSATITWQTNEGARGKVYYDDKTFQTADATRLMSEPSISGSVVLEQTFGFTHSLTLQDLVAGTTYFYIVQSTDAEGNVMVTFPKAFTTR